MGQFMAGIADVFKEIEKYEIKLEKNLEKTSKNIKKQKNGKTV